MKIQLEEIISANTVEWCKLPYPNHPKGCPNFGKRGGCPPDAPLWQSLVESPYLLVYQRFDLEAQENRMLKKHPNWSTRQARCCLYWQKSVTSSVIAEAQKFVLLDYLFGSKSLYIIKNPEGAGVDLFRTCRLVGIELERDYLNQKYVYKMVLVGRKFKHGRKI